MHLRKLVEMEYLLVHRGGRGQSFVYELLYDGKGKNGKPFLPGLIDITSLTATDHREHPKGEQEEGGSTQGAAGEVGSSDHETPRKSNDAEPLPRTRRYKLRKAHQASVANDASYPLVMTGAERVQ